MKELGLCYLWAMRISILLGTLFVLIIGSSGLAAADKKAPLKKVLARYQNAPAVEAKIEKTVDMPTLNEKKVSPGRLFFLKGLFRLEMGDEENTTVVLDGETLWVATHAPEEFGGKWQVMRSAATNLKKANSLLAMLFGDDRLLDQMNLIRVQKKDGLQIYQLTPKKAAGLEIKDLEIAFKGQSELLQSVRYGDDLGNQTTYIFKSSDLKSSIKRDKFKYTPPKNAEVTNF